MVCEMVCASVFSRNMSVFEMMCEMVCASVFSRNMSVCEMMCGVVCGEVCVGVCVDEECLSAE